jgi:hypothetical protein
MNGLITLTSLNSNVFVDVPCTDGEEIRIQSLFSSAEPGAEGDEMIVTMGRQSSPQLKVSTGPVVNGTTDITASIGGKQTPMMQTQIDAVTGVVSYSQSPTTAGANMPDIWWNYGVRVSLVVTGAVNSKLTVLYEQRRIK